MLMFLHIVNMPTYYDLNNLRFISCLMIQHFVFLHSDGFGMLTVKSKFSLYGTAILLTWWGNKVKWY
jgi:hypothetical protein